jgi:4-amino-4-deoxychorismate lyase
VGVLADGDVRLVDPAAPVFSAFDLAPTRGDGAFESLLVQAGQPRKVPAHLARLRRSATALGIAGPSSAEWERLIAALLAEPVETDAVLKLVLSRGVEGEAGYTAIGTVSPLSADILRQRRSGIAVVTLSLGWPAAARPAAPWLLGGIKSLSYAINLAAGRQARERGADDVIFTSTEGLLLEGPTSSVVWAVGSTLRTPPVSTGILAGTTQQALFAAAGPAGLATETSAGTVAELHAADGVWLVSSVRGAAEVVALDGRTRSPADLTPLVQRLTGIG